MRKSWRVYLQHFIYDNLNPPIWIRPLNNYRQLNATPNCEWEPCNDRAQVPNWNLARRKEILPDRRPRISPARPAARMIGGAGRGRRRASAPASLPTSTSARRTEHSVSCWYCDCKIYGFYDTLFGLGSKYARFMRGWFSIGVCFSLIALVGISLVSCCLIIVPNVLYIIYKSWKCSFVSRIPWCHQLLLLNVIINMIYNAYTSLYMPPLVVLVLGSWWMDVLLLQTEAMLIFYMHFPKYMLAS